jgi:hypothetical protein
VALSPLDEGAGMLFAEAASGDTAADQVELVLGGEPRPEALLAEGEQRRLKVEVQVGSKSHPYLGDHAIAGTPVVPVAFVIEWFARTARAFCPELVFAGLHRLEVLRGVPLPNFSEGHERLVVDCCETSSGASAVGISDGTMLSLQLSDGNGKIYYRATAELTAVHKDPATDHGNEAELAFEDWGRSDLYDSGVLFHGPEFQMLRKINGISDHGIAADLTGVLEPGWAGSGRTNDRSVVAPEPWCTDPIVFDGGLQLALLWCERVLGGASLPTGIASIRTWSNDPAPGPFSCTLRGRSAAGSKSVSDARFFDANGRMVAELGGIETHLLPGQAGGRA